MYLIFIFISFIFKNELIDSISYSTENFQMNVNDISYALSLVSLLTIEHVGETWPGPKQFSRMLGPWLQPPIHVGT